MKELIKDGKVVLKFEDDFDVMKFIHRNESFSMDYCFKFKGYKVQEGAK
jgi:hypothetical protein